MPGSLFLKVMFVYHPLHWDLSMSALHNAAGCKAVAFPTATVAVVLPPVVTYQQQLLHM
jgi:hypothetical protein